MFHLYMRTGNAGEYAYIASHNIPGELHKFAGIHNAKLGDYKIVSDGHPFIRSSGWR